MIVQAMWVGVLFSFFSPNLVWAKVPDLQKNRDFREKICEVIAAHGHFFSFEKSWFSVEADPLQFSKVLDLSSNDIKIILENGTFDVSKYRNEQNQNERMQSIVHNGNLIQFYEIQYPEKQHESPFPSGLRFTLVQYDYQADDPDDFDVDEGFKFHLNLLDPFIRSVIKSDANVRGAVSNIKQLHAAEDNLRRILLVGASTPDSPQDKFEDAQLLVNSFAREKFKKASLNTFVEWIKQNQVESNLPPEKLAKDIILYTTILEIKKRASPQYYTFYPITSFVKALAFIEAEKFKSLAKINFKHITQSSEGEMLDEEANAAIAFCESKGGKINSYRIGAKETGDIARLCAFGDSEIGAETLYRSYLSKKRASVIDVFLEHMEKAAESVPNESTSYPYLNVIPLLNTERKYGENHLSFGSDVEKKVSDILGNGAVSGSAFYLNPNANGQSARISEFCHKQGGITVKLYQLPHMTKIVKGCVFNRDDSGINARTLFLGVNHPDNQKLKEVLESL